MRARRSFAAEVREVRTADGDAFRLHVAGGPAGTPAVLLLHGLEGDANSVWIQEVGARVLERGLRPVALELRGCGARLNPAPRLYHMGDFGDVGTAVAAVLDQLGPVPLALFGVSMGGALVANWLARHALEVPEPVRGGVALGLPFDLEVTGPLSDRAAFGLYRRHFLAGLRERALRKAAQHPGLLNPEAVRSCRTLEDFDTKVTARLHGFEDAWDYWRRCSCGPWLEQVRVPLLLVSGSDDPLVPPSSYPERRGRCEHRVLGGGGHLGFVEGRWPFRPRRSLPDALADRLAALCGGKP